MIKLSLGLDEADGPAADASGIGPLPFGTLEPPPLRARPPAVAVSGVIHALSALGLVALLRVSTLPAAPAPTTAPPRPRVFLPSLATLRALQGLPPRPRPQEVRNRISVGAPSAEKRPLVLRPEDDLTRAPVGERLAQGDVGRYQPESAEAPPPTSPASPDVMERPGSGRAPRFQVGNAIARAVAASSGRWGDAAGADQSGMGLQFDPQGADFSRWMQHFKTEVYRNWIAPQAAQWGIGGQVGFEFVVERSGALSVLLTTSGSGTVSLDRAAEHALRASRFLALPDDYAPAQVTMRVTFNYGLPADSHAPTGSRH